jgi:hypothetical protein
VGPFDECKYWPLFKINNATGWNDVKLLDFVPTNDCDGNVLKDTMVSTVREIGKAIFQNVVVGGIGAYTVDDDVDKYYLVQWTELPREIIEDQEMIVENTLTTVFAGDWICDGIWLDQVTRAKVWYTAGETAVTVRMKNVLHADLVMTPNCADNPLPRLHPTMREHVLPLNPHKLWLIDHDFMMDEINRREPLNYDEDVDQNDNDSHSSSSDDDKEGVIEDSDDDAD